MYEGLENFNEITGKRDSISICMIFFLLNVLIILSIDLIDRYEMLSNKDIANIPIAKLVRVDRTLVAIWCTNAPSMIQAVRDRLIAKWSLKILATWFWIKVYHRIFKFFGFN